MKCNVGKTDQIIRIIAGLGLLLFFFLESPLQYVGILGIVFIVTAFVKFCPLYTLFGMSTCKTNSKTHGA